MKKNYSSPKMEVVELEKENMILTSGDCLRDGPICLDKCRVICKDNIICEALQIQK